MSSKSDVGRFFRHSTIYAIGSAINRAGAFLLLPLYTRHLSTGEYGTLEMYYVIASVVSGLLSVGIAHATLRFYFDYSEQHERNALVTTNLIASLLISACGAFAVFLAAEPLSHWVLGSAGPPMALELVLITLVLELSSQVTLAYLRAQEKSVFFVVLSIGKLAVQCIANFIALTRFDAGVTGILFGNLLAVAAGWLVLFVYTLAQCGLHFDVAKISPVLRYSLPFLYITVLSLISANLDRFLINSLISIEAVGLYALAQKFAKLIGDLIGEPFNRSYGAFRFTIMKQPDAAAIQARVFRYAAAALAIVSMGVAYFAVDVIRIMAAEAYLPSARLVAPLALAASIGVLTYVVQTGVLYAKQSADLFRITLIRTMVVAVVAYPVIALFGLNGICTLAIVDALLVLSLTHRASQRYFKVRYEMGRLGMLVALVAAFYVASLPTALLAPYAGMFAKMLLFAAFVVALYASSVLAADEKAWIRQHARLLLARRSHPAT